jgi:hypothetical protein
MERSVDVEAALLQLVRLAHLRMSTATIASTAERSCVRSTR